MARKPRIHFPGAVYHVILRGNAGQPIFFAEHDRYRFYLLLNFAVEKFGCRIHGFCLMTNHLHLVMQAGDTPLSVIMQNVSLRYTKWINFSQSRSGHLFQGRYKALLIDADAYLLELVRYIHLNPVRAGMTSSPDNYLWSGHHAYLGEETLPWLTTDWVLSQFSAVEWDARPAYARFIAEGMAEEQRADFHRGTCEGRILGDDYFIDHALAQVNEQRARGCTLSDILEAVCHRYGVTIEQLKAPGKARPYAEARAVAALLVQELPGPSLTGLGKSLHRDIAPLGRIGRRLREQLTTNEQLRSQVEEIRQKLLSLQRVIP